MANVKGTGSAFVYSVVTDGFAPAANYHNVRSGYTEESVEFLLSKLGLLREGATEDRSLTVLELDCGTGKFTQVSMLDILKELVRVTIAIIINKRQMCGSQVLLPYTLSFSAFSNVLPFRVHLAYSSELTVLLILTIMLFFLSAFIISLVYEIKFVLISGRHFRLSYVFVTNPLTELFTQRCVKVNL